MAAAACFGLGSMLARFAPNFDHRHATALVGAPRWHSVWIFVLLVVVSLWCVQNIASLRVAFARKKHARAALKCELALRTVVTTSVVALGVYVWFVVASPSEQFEVTAQGTNIHGEFYRALRIETEPATRRGRQPVAVWLERRIGTVTDRIRVERGKWWPSRVAGYELALARGRLISEGSVFRQGRQKVTLNVDQPVQHGVLTLLLRALRHLGHDALRELHRAELEVNGKRTSLALDPEWAGDSAFLGQKETPVVVLRVHRSLSGPLAGLAIVLLGVGVGLWRFESRLAARSQP